MRVAFATATAFFAAPATPSFVSVRVARESPRSVDERANAAAHRVGVGDVDDLLLAGLNEVLAVASDANVGVVGAGHLRGVERVHHELARRGVHDRRCGRGRERLLERRRHRVRFAQRGFGRNCAGDEPPFFRKSLRLVIGVCSIGIFEMRRGPKKLKSAPSGKVSTNHCKNPVWNNDHPVRPLSVFCSAGYRACR